MAIYEDRWLSDRFGHPVFSVSSDGAAVLAEHAARREGVSYQARVDAVDVAAVAALEDAGMRTVNVAITLGRDPGPVDGGGEGVDVRDADPDADAPLLDVAQRSFSYSRFHLDPAVPDEVANRVKRDWVGSYLRGIRGEQLLVAVRDGEPVGFLAVIAREDEDGRRVRVIDLVAVAPEARRLGAGRALVRRFHEECAGRCDAVEVGTQLANPPALRFYERLGYMAERAAFDLHMHI